jgi:alkylation response protein AidB-like acyl-CoA dehydrogenase
VGDEYVVNGGKVWTTYADKSDWIFCLVRTGPKEPKHAGISFLLFDLETAGIERRPIRLISGASPFCQTFFNDVRVPAENLVGPVNGGWTIAKRLLEYERQNVAGAGFGADALRQIEEILIERLGPALNPVLRDKLAAYRMYAEALQNFSLKNERRVAAEGASPLVSVVKIGAAKANQMRSELLIDALGLEALGWGGDMFSEEALTETRAWLRAKANSIEGGTSEINLNILAKAVLGLPGGA